MAKVLLDEMSRSSGSILLNGPENRLIRAYLFIGESRLEPRLRPVILARIGPSGGKVRLVDVWKVLTSSAGRVTIDRGFRSLTPAESGVYRIVDVTRRGHVLRV